MSCRLRIYCLPAGRVLLKALPSTICMLIAAIFMLAALCSAVAQSNQLNDALRLLDAWTANRVASRGIPGLSIGIVVGNKLVWTQGYGYADLEKKVRVTPQTLFGIRSITKTFTAVAILQLRDAGKLQLDDPVANHLRELHILKHSPGSPPVTIRELLTHTSGLQRDPPGTIWTDGIYSSDADLKAPLLQIYEPSTRWYYSNLGFALLGEVVAAEGHQPWHSYIQEHILTPLGMNNTRPVPQRGEPGLAVIYLRSAPGGTPVLADPALQARGPTAIDGAGAMASNVEDLAKYVAFQMSEGSTGNSTVLSGPTLREMHRPQWMRGDWQNAWGLGIGVRRVDGYVQVGHEGGGGYASDIQFIPALKLGAIVLANSEDDDPGDYIDYALQLLTPIISNSSPKAKYKLNADSYGYIGLYQAQRLLFRMIVANLGRNLVLLTPDESNPYRGGTILEPTHEPRVFFMREADAGPSGSPGEKLTFDVSADGMVTGFHTDSMRFSRIGPLTK
jgi:CubicO group peptidase (beta-lactamase class C family)